MSGGRIKVASLFETVDPDAATRLVGHDREDAERLICANHYTHSVPSGKSHYVAFRSAIVVWSIPSNKNIGTFLLGRECNCWELARLWAPDGHEPNLLTKAISKAVGIIKRIERPDILVSYADPNVGHGGGVYRAAGWLYHGRCEESRAYQGEDGAVLARRAFHSGDRSMTKAEIEAAGYSEIKVAGKHRFVRPLTKRAAADLRPA
jgi:hypothetical protein